MLCQVSAIAGDGEGAGAATTFCANAGRVDTAIAPERKASGIRCMVGRLAWNDEFVWQTWDSFQHFGRNPIYVARGIRKMFCSVRLRWYASNCV